MARFNKLKEEVTRENVSDKEGENNVQVNMEHWCKKSGVPGYLC